MADNNRKGILILILKYGYCAFMLAMFLLVVLTPYGSRCQNNLGLPMWLIAVFGLVMWVGLYFVFDKLKNKPADKPSWIVGIATVIEFLSLVLISHNYYFITGWDTFAVYCGAENIAAGTPEGINAGYFSVNPNNKLITLIFGQVMKLVRKFAGLNNNYFACIIFQCFLFAVSGYLVYRIAGMLTDLKGAVISYIVYTLFIGLSPWVTVPYSDGLGLIFPLVVMYFIMLAYKCDKTIIKSLLTAAAFATGGFAYKIKPQLFIVLIAVAMIYIANNFKKLKNKKGIIVMASAAVGTVAGFAAAIMLLSTFPIETDKNMEKDIWYFLCTGANSDADGICNIEDQDFHYSFNDSSERKPAFRERYFNRLKENGFAGTWDLLKRKSLLNYNDGTFGWYNEGEFVIEMIYPDKMPLRNLLGGLFYSDGKLYQSYKCTVQAVWLSIMLLNVLLIFSKGKKHGLNEIMLSIVGLSIFELIFECRARYLFCYAPFYLIGAVCALNCISKMMKKK